MESATRTRSRGFASMDAEKQREIARKGGRAAHEKGTAHEFTSAEARAAGRKGGERVSSNREHMSRIGRIGGKSSANRRQTVASQGADRDHGRGGAEHGMHPGEGSGHSAQDFGSASSASHGGFEASSRSHAERTEAEQPIQHQGGADRFEPQAQQSMSEPRDVEGEESRDMGFDQESDSRNDSDNARNEFESASQSS